MLVPKSNRTGDGNKSILVNRGGSRSRPACDMYCCALSDGAIQIFPGYILRMICICLSRHRAPPRAPPLIKQFLTQSSYERGCAVLCGYREVRRRCCGNETVFPVLLFTRRREGVLWLFKPFVIFFDFCCTANVHAVHSDKILCEWQRRHNP